MKKLLELTCAFVLAFVLILTSGVNAKAEPISPQNDYNNHWAKEFINFVVEKDLFLGVSSKNFKPDEFITREILVSAMARLEGESAKYTNNFKDVPSSSMYAPYIAWANSKSIVLGFPDGNFLPQNAITRQQLAVVFVQYLKYKGIPIPSIANTTKFDDDGSIGKWALNYVYQIKELGIIVGKPTSVANHYYFDPNGVATRAEVATMIKNLYTKYISIEKPPMGGYSDDRSLTRDEYKIFEEALRKTVGVKYEALKVATQVVAGTNYRFYAKATTLSSTPESYHAYVYVYKDLQGNISLKNIERLDTIPIENKPSEPGAYTQERALTQEDKDVFKAALKDSVGVNYEPLNVATQVVSGINYRFYARATAIITNVTPYYVYVYAYKDLKGRVILNKIEEIQDIEKPVVGAYTQDRNLTQEDIDIFKDAIKNEVGVNYEPFKVATQVVNGTNYRFYARATAIITNVTPYYVHLYAYKDLKGVVTLTKIEEIPNIEKPVAGGYSEERAVTQEDISIFNEAMKGKVGVNYEPIKVATQVVNGTNYKFYVKATVVVPGATPTYTYVYIYKPINGVPELVSIDN